MKRTLLSALILSGFVVNALGAAPESDFNAAATVRKHTSRTVTVTRTPVSHLPAVAAGPSTPVAPDQTRIGGGFPRMAQATPPLQMFNPLAPPEYGSGRDLVVYEAGGNVTTNENNRRIHPEGLRLLTVHPIW